jgi:hypothetical protein
VRTLPQFANGKLNSCVVEFSALAQDWAYKQGAYIRVGGSFGLMNAQGKSAVVLKVILHDFDPKRNTYTPSPPASAYFISGTSTTKNSIVGSYPSDIPGAIFVVSQLSPGFEIIAEGLAADRLTIAFARTKGGTDIQLPIDTTVLDTADNGERTRSPKASLEFYDCAKSLLSQTQPAP